MIVLFTLVQLTVILLAVGFCLLVKQAFSQRAEAAEVALKRAELLHREQRVNWERERERLMNRVMVKEWTTYAQMSQAATLSSIGQDEPSVGMNDEEELRRIGDVDGIGEPTFQIDLTQDLEELGLLR